MAHKEDEGKFPSKLDAVRCITRNGGRVDSNKRITIASPGLKVLSAIDYLVNNHRHIWLQDA